MKYISVSNYLNILGLTHFNSVARIGDCFTTFAMTQIGSRLGKSGICHCAKYLSLSALRSNLKSLRLLPCGGNDKFRLNIILRLLPYGGNDRFRTYHCEGQYNRGI